MEEYELASVRLRSAHGAFVMDCEDGQKIEFELSGIGRDHVYLVPTVNAAAGFAGLRAPLLWVMSGPEKAGQEEPAVLRVGAAHSLFVADGDQIRTIGLPVATRLYAVFWEFNSEVPAQQWPQSVFPPGQEFKPSPPPNQAPEATDPVQSEGGE